MMNKEYRMLNGVHGNNIPVLRTCGYHVEPCTTMIVGALHMVFFCRLEDEATADSELFNAVRSNDADRFEDEATTADLSACEAPDNVGLRTPDNIELKAPDNVGLKAPDNVGLRTPDNVERKWKNEFQNSQFNAVFDFNAVRSNDADRLEDEATADLSACEAPDNVGLKAPDNVELRTPDNVERKGKNEFQNSQFNAVFDFNAVRSNDADRLEDEATAADLSACEAPDNVGLKAPDNIERKGKNEFQNSQFNDVFDFNAVRSGDADRLEDEATADSELFNAVRSNDADRFEDEATADLSACEAPDNVGLRTPDNVGLRTPEKSD